VIYSGALTADVLFGDQELIGGFQITVVNASWMIGVLAAVYVVAGGLKACAWADLIQGSALILGGAIVSYLAFQALGNADPQAIGLAAEHASAGAIERFRELNSAKLHMVLPRTDLILPWTALVVGLWIPNFYYWGLNQYITQRTLGAHSLADGQKGVVFAAALKLLIPFIIVIPGVIAFNLFSGEMRQAAAKENQTVLDQLAKAQADPQAAKMAFEFNANFAELYPDVAAEMLAVNRAAAGQEADSNDAPAEGAVEQNSALLKQIAGLNSARAAGEQIAVQSTVVGYKFVSAFALLLKHLVHPGVRGFVLAALLGAVISSLASMLNAASTIFTMDLYRAYLNPTATQGNLVAMGRLCVVVFAAIGCYISPYLGDPRFKGIFTYIQEFQGFFSPGVLAVFIFGLFIHRAPRACGVMGLLISPAAYGFLKWVGPEWGLPEIAFLDRMAISFATVLIVLGTMTVLRPLPEPVTLPVQTKIALDSSAGAKFWGVVVVIATLALYWVFF
jgi:SSS family solute:Na+ symporter